MEPTHFESLFPDTARFEEIQKLLYHIKGGNAAELVGLPGVGRSTLLRLLPYNRPLREKHLGDNEKWYHFVLVDFSEIQDRPLPDAIKHLFLALSASLKERHMDEEYAVVNTLFRESSSHNDDLVLLQGLKQAIDFLCIEKERTVVLLFDKFETYAPMLTPQFFVYCKALQNRAKYRLPIVFSTNRPLEQVLDETVLPDVHTLLGQRRICLAINDTPTLSFIISYIEKVTQKKIAQDIRETVAQLTAGHGKLTKLALEQIIAEQTTADIQEFLQGDKTVRSMLYEIWEHCTAEEQEALKHLVREEETTIPDYLTQSNLVENQKITIPLFLSFVAYRSERQEEKLTLSPDGKDIYKGQALLSDYLTAYEFRLLKYFLQNADTIIERNQLIDAVWQDAKSTAGVSEQALDQLIFRVRRKIERDPNAPTHILTVKGRGFKFLP